MTLPFLRTVIAVVLAGSLSGLGSDPLDDPMPAVVDTEGRMLPVLRGGWYLWAPYQYLQPRDELRVEGMPDELTGIDVDITNLVAREAGYAVDFTFRPWLQHTSDLEAGRADIASGATWKPTADPGLRFSIPYRTETNVLYFRRGESRKVPPGGLADVLAFLRENGLRAGVIRGFVYVAPELNAFVGDPAHRDLIVFAENDYENFRHLADRQVDVVFADRLAGAAAAWRGGWNDEVELHPIRAKGDICFAFSEKTVSAATVHRFNEAITASRGDLDRIVSQYKLPVLLGPILGSRWFLVMDIIGTVAFALSGVLLAARDRFSIFGALLLAALPAVGGGIIRDLLVGRDTLAVLASPLYVELVLGTVLGGYLVLFVGRRTPNRWKHRVRTLFPTRSAQNLFQISDAIGLSAFTITGASVALSARAEPIWIWVPALAAITAAGGGILRDIVRRVDRVSSLQTELYAEIPILWSLLLVAIISWAGPNLDPDRFFWAVVFVLCGAFATRTAAVFLRWKSPAFNPAKASNP